MDNLIELIIVMPCLMVLHVVCSVRIRPLSCTVLTSPTVFYILLSYFSSSEPVSDMFLFPV
jgi:hypothetical protein